MRIWICLLFAKVKFLKTDKSVRLKPGPRTALRGWLDSPAGRGRGPTGETAGIEPLSHGSRTALVGIAGHVGTIREAGQGQNRIGDREWEAGLGLEDAVQLPAAENRAHGRGLVGELRQFHAEAEHEPMTDVEERRPLFLIQSRLQAGIVAEGDGKNRAVLARRC